MSAHRLLSGAVLILLAVLTIKACSAERAPAGGGWVAEWDTIGDTVVVRTVSGSVWDEPVEMVEDLSIGVLDGAEELMFGSIGSMAVDEEGGIYAFDRRVPALRHFDSQGEYIGTLGREGGGPGEYGEWSDMFAQLHQLPGQQSRVHAFFGALTVRRDGKIVLADLGNARLNLYEPDGTLAEQWAMQGGIYSRQGIAADTADHIYVSIVTEAIRPTAALDVGYLHLDPQGNVLDTMPVPTLPSEPEARRLGPTDPSKEHVLSPLGHMVVGVTDDYSFEVRWPDGRTVRIERAYEPVSFVHEERAEWQAVLDWFKAAEYPVDLGSVPDRKLPYSSFLADEQGRIWVRRHVTAHKDGTIEPPSDGWNGPPLVSWVEPDVYDVFEPEGTYLGEARFPWRTTPLVVRGDTAWGVRRGDFDEQYIVRLVMPR